MAGDGVTRVSKARGELADADRERLMAYRMVWGLADAGRLRDVLPTLMFGLSDHPAWGKLRLWRLDSAMFGTSRKRALRWVRKARRLAGDTSTMKDGYATLAWAVESREATVRLTAWLWLLARREGLAAPLTVPVGFPYATMYEDTGTPEPPAHDGTGEGISDGTDDGWETTDDTTA